MLNVRINDRAYRALGSAGLPSVTPSELAAGLRELLTWGIDRRGDVLAFGGYSGWAGEPPGGYEDLTGWECAVTSFHLEDRVPVHVDVVDAVPVISEQDQLVLLRQGTRFAMEVVRLAGALADPVPVRCIVSANSTNGTFRFHRARTGESLLAPDLDTYTEDKIVTVDSGPASLGGTPW
ncbi:hypothetical protein [Amycolatopsis sp. YIM 10]|uniref:hypothetical protein n=1 Tax=Amycolatopsis sp. YIM 10 TaxID=2653857 RepID=UPI0012A9A7AD|nr:hypothetical protein [Amycolatopsis sp. YIM 10]QFU89840.1 hypothetical protein YIM_23315 [Amycolatopsis sp. YIM 10]